MTGVNKVILVGNLGRAPEAKPLQSGEQLASFSLATTDKWTDRQGQKQERTEWHRVVAFGKLADTCIAYLQKGRSVYVEGRLKTREWTDKDGVKKSSTEVVADEVKFLGGPRSERGGEGAAEMNAALFGGGFDELPAELPN